jgi:hypothetical protein
LQVDAQAVGERDHDEQDVPQFGGETPVAILRRPRFLAVRKVDLARELSHFLREARKLRERRPVAPTGDDPAIDLRLPGRQRRGVSVRHTAMLGRADGLCAVS